MTPPPPRGGATTQRDGFVYLLKSDRDGAAYVGWTTDLSRRLVEHNDLVKPRVLNRAAVGRRWEVVG